MNWRSFISPLTEFSSSLLQIPILNKSKWISIFGPYHPSRVITLCTYYLSSDHKCGGEIPFIHIPTLRFTTTSGPEHDSALNPGAVPSYCILPLFHAAAQEGQVPFSSINGMTPIEPYICYSRKHRSCFR